MPQVALGAIALGGAALKAGGLAAALASTTMLGVIANVGASMLLSGVAGALMGGAATAENMAGRQVSVREPASARQLVYGYTRKGGSIVFLSTSGDPGNPNGTKFLHLVIVLAAHQVENIGAIYFDGTEALRADGSATDRVIFRNGRGTYQMAWVEKQYGWERGYSPFASLKAHLPAKWTDAHRLEGCAAIHIKMDYQSETYPSGVPNITAEVWGRNDIYDPRSGRAGYSNNAALCLANYMADRRYGIGAAIGATDGIRTANLIAAANVCDEWVESHGVWEQRYRCNGVVDASATPKAAIEDLLTAMAGKAIRKGGSWAIHAGAYQMPSLQLSKDDAAGAVTLVTRMSRAENFNGVRGVFVSPQNDWQLDDFPAYRSQVYVDEDLGRESWRDITLPFTTSPYAAQRIAKIELETARRQMSVQFPARLRALQASCGDTVTLTWDTWGAVNKPFSITSMTLQDAGGGTGIAPVLSLSEISPLAWTWHATEGQIYAAAPRAQLPKPWYMAPPGITGVTEELYVTRAGNGTAARSVITWSPSPDPRVDRYVLQASRDGITWSHVAETIATTATHDGWSPGAMSYAVQAIGQMGQRSSWAEWRGQLYGLAVPPAALRNVSIQVAGGLAVIKWALPDDLDVRYGGRVVVRHAANAGAAWSNSIALDEVPGSTTIGVVSLMPGVYFIRPIDGSGQYGPITTLYADGAQAVEFVPTGLLQADDEFSGSHDGTIMSGGTLTLSDTGLFDAVPNTDALLSWDYPYGVTSRGVYTFATALAWPAAKRVRLRALIEMAPLVINDEWDHRSGEVDGWSSWDALAEAECNVEMQVRTTTDNPAAAPVWSDWSRLDAGEYRARGIQARAILTSTSPDIAPVVSILRVHADEVAT